jgi:hypothetical protein
VTVSHLTLAGLGDFSFNPDEEKRVGHAPRMTSVVNSGIAYTLWRTGAGFCLEGIDGRSGKRAQKEACLGTLTAIARSFWW